jgi:sugar/nucleoside kinase (ribokinase family)
MKVLVIGDVIDDIIVLPKGQIRANTDTASHISHTYGGSAANIASWAAFNKADVSFVGCVGETDVVRVQEQFAQFDVKVNLQHCKLNTGTLVSIVEGPQRTMLTDRGANAELDFNKMTDSYLAEFGFVFISGYSIFGKTVADVQTFISRVKAAGCKVLIDPGSVGFIQDYGVEEFLTATKGTDILLPNDEEFEVLGTNYPFVIVTKGDAGVDLYEHGQLVESFAVEKLEAIDPTGAGDSFSGAVLATLANGRDMRNAIAAGVKSAAMAVMTIGARPQI